MWNAELSSIIRVYQEFSFVCTYMYSEFYFNLSISENMKKFKNSKEDNLDYLDNHRLINPIVFHLRTIDRSWNKFEILFTFQKTKL